MTTDRTFVALWPSSAQREALADLRDRLTVAAAGGPRAPRLRFVAPEAAHLTLAFLGDVPHHRQDEVAAAARRAAAGRAPFRWALEGVGAFPAPVRPRVAWVGVGQGRGEIVALQADLTAELHAAGLGPPDGRPFAPHVTIARARGRPTGTLTTVAFQAPAATVAAVDVVVSELRADGPRYRRVARLPLGGLTDT